METSTWKCLTRHSPLTFTRGKVRCGSCHAPCKLDCDNIIHSQWRHWKSPKPCFGAFTAM
jgi:hypothetical protein